MKKIVCLMLLICGWARGADSSDFAKAAEAGDIKSMQQMLCENPGLVNAPVLKVTYGHYYVSPPLIRAIRAGRYDVVEYLIMNGADVNAEDDVSLTGLHHAVSRGQSAIVKLLLQHGAGAVVNKILPTSETAIFTAIHRGYPEIVKLLVDHHADTTIKNRRGETAYDSAVYMVKLVESDPSNHSHFPKCREIVRMLEESKTNR